MSVEFWMNVLIWILKFVKALMEYRILLIFDRVFVQILHHQFVHQYDIISTYNLNERNYYDP